MDPFEDALDDLRISGLVMLNRAFSPDWAVQMPHESDIRKLLGVGSDKRAIPFHLVRRGGFDLTSERESMRLDEPELVLLPGGDAHRLGVGQSARAAAFEDIVAGNGPPLCDPSSSNVTELICGAFIARAAPLNPLFGALPTMLKVSAAGDSTNSSLSGVASLLAADLKHNSRNSFTAQRLLEVLCAEAIRTFMHSRGTTNAGWFNGLADPKISVALRQIHERPNEALSLESLADKASLSPSRFAARFKEKVGQSVMGYVSSWRANLACRLLRETDLPLSEVARRVGFESMPAFSRSFKAHIGKPPATWRELQA
jgi:AraC-like DNA-binding protein